MLHLFQRRLETLSEVVELGVVFGALDHQRVHLGGVNKGFVVVKQLGSVPIVCG